MHDEIPDVITIDLGRWRTYARWGDRVLRVNRGGNEVGSTTALFDWLQSVHSGDPKPTIPNPPVVVTHFELGRRTFRSLSKFINIVVEELRVEGS